MYLDKKILGIIPARGGSKGIPRKNILPINGRPLIDYTIRAALDCKWIDKVIVSTDDDEIASVALNCGAEVPFLRPKVLASDDAKTIDAVLYTIKALRQSNFDAFDYLVLLQPTQPLRQHWHIREALELSIKSNGKSLTSVTKVNEHPILMRTITEECILKPLLNVSSTVRRQDFMSYYRINGALYVNRIEEITEHTSFNDNELGYIMDTKYDVDIDEEIDLEIFKLKMLQINGK